VVQILKSIQSKELPNAFISFDSETWKKEVTVTKTTKKLDNKTLINQHFLSFGYGFYCERNNENEEFIRESPFYFEDKEIFTKWIINHNMQGKVLYVFAHNIAYDFRVAIDGKQLIDNGYVLTTAISKNVFIYKYVKKNYSIIFLSTTNYFRVSLKELGKTFGLEKIDYEINDENLLKIKNKDKESIAYCFRDVEIVECVVIALINFMRSNNCNFAFTIASTAFNIFRQNYYNENIMMHKNPEIENIEHDSYHGGRTECFKVGKFENIYKLDINSMYPDCMYNEVYPIEKMLYVKKGTKELLFKYLNDDKSLIIANVNVDIKDMKVPYIDKNNNKLLYPIGKFNTTLALPELKLLNYDEIISCNEILVYKKYPIFKEFVDTYYNLRLKFKKEKNEVMQFFCKIVLNSLYGKLAQKVTKEERIEEFDNFLINGYLDYSVSNKKYKLKYINGQCFNITDDKSGFNTFTPISSFVTSYARVKLYKMISLVYGELIYVDTDSLFVTKKGYEILLSNGFIDKDKLGFLKLEGVMKTLDIRTGKDYSFEEDGEIHHKIKSINKKAIKDAVDNNEDIGTKQSWKINNILGYNESIRHFNLIVGDMDEEKIMSRIYNKGIVKGNTVYPIELNELEVIK
jgi:hypothetical protein